MSWALTWLMVAPLLPVEVGVLPGKPYTEWSLDEAVRVLNHSPWGKQTTFTRVIGGVGSGISGEKEIYSTFYTRLLSARPIREALARVQQINHDYDSLSEEGKNRFDALLESGLQLNPDRWIVVSLGFRSNNPEEQDRVHRFLKAGSAETLKGRAFLSTESHPRVELAAYFPPGGDGIGAKFIFPRYRDGEPVVSSGDKTLVFGFDTPGGSDLSVVFSIEAMRTGGRPDL